MHEQVIVQDIPEVFVPLHPAQEVSAPVYGQVHQVFVGLRPERLVDTETRKVTAMMLVILKQMSRKFAYSRRMKDLRDLEAQHEATVSKSATDDRKLRMHSEFKAICVTDETRL